MISRWFLGVLVLSLGCGGGGESSDAGNPDERGGDARPPGCVDDDGDGAGLGADCATRDCDDTDRFTISECGTGCDERPDRLGCPCDPESGPLTCYRGLPEEAGVGTCTPGLQTCLAGVRGPCEGQELPEDEYCDELDNDCDGVVDDGVGGECGGCGDCASSCFADAAGCASWASGTLDDAVSVASGLTLSPEPPVDERVVWPGDGSGQKVFKVSSPRREILGAYFTAHVRGIGLDESVVDRQGDVYLGHGDQGWVTKIAAREADCPDRNGNATVDTSGSWDDVRPFDIEDDPEDECILWQTRLPETVQGLALQEAYGLDRLVHTLWVGIEDRRDADLDSGYWELDAETGDETGRVVLAPGQGPHAMAIDHRGVIWAVDGSNRLAELDPERPDDGLTVYEIDGPINQRRFYSLEVDENGVPWPSSVGPMRFDAESETVEPAYLDWQWKAGLAPTAPGNMAPDGMGGLWHGDAGFADPFRINVETLEWRGVPVGSFDNGVYEVGVDLLGQLWVLASGDPAALLDLTDEAAQPVLVLTECGQPDCIRSPPAGDFTGLPWALLQPRRGVWTDALVACEPDRSVQWTKLRVDADVPGGARVTLLVRTGIDEDELWQGPWIEVGTARDGETELLVTGLLGDESRQHHRLAVQARLEADRTAGDPVVHRLDVLWGCQGPVE
jgi:hypothetical protein